MNAERAPGQQGEANRTPQPPEAEATATRPSPGSSAADDMETGQASYGNSGETGNDLGQGPRPQQGPDEGMFGTSAEDVGNSNPDATADPADQQDPVGQAFADQGQGAPDDDVADVTKDDGTAAIERSQGHETDIEGIRL